MLSILDRDWGLSMRLYSWIAQYLWNEWNELLRMMIQESNIDMNSYCASSEIQIYVVGQKNWMRRQRGGREGVVMWGSLENVANRVLWLPAYVDWVLEPNYTHDFFLLRSGFLVAGVSPRFAGSRRETFRNNARKREAIRLPSPSRASIIRSPSIFINECADFTPHITTIDWMLIFLADFGRGELCVLQSWIEMWCFGIWNKSSIDIIWISLIR